VSRLKDWLIAGAVLALGRRRPPRPPRQEHRIVPPGAPDRSAETVVILLFAASALSAIGFVAVYALDRLPDQTQLLGLALGLAFLFLAAASIAIGERLVVTEELEEDYPPPEHEREQEELEQLVEESGERFTRRRLVTLAGAGAAGALGVAILTPAASLGPVLDLASFVRSPWRRGRRLVDGDGRPLAAAAVEEGTFYTAFPDGADREQLASPLVVVRLPTADLRLPDGRGGWAPHGILAYSKVCTHAGCAIALYRKPTFAPTQPKPALVCPCHYSTFDPASGGAVLFGPAGRPLPQLPLAIDAAGNLRAAGDFSGPVGPSWWGVRSRRPT
jgi:ubiquinol-cytochrome c reductase iron-sulfur subunit